MVKSSTDHQAPRDARRERERAVAETRRGLILDAARSAFFELGLEGASLREIAKRAGYTPGAIYSYFASKEEIYAALLGESLQRLQARVAEAGRPELPPAGRLRAAAGAFFDFYRDNPRDLDLGFYLFHGVQPRGLTRELDHALNARLWESLRPSQEALESLGMSSAAARAELTALFAHSVGLLVLDHSGRIRMFGQQARTLFDRYLEALLARARA